MKFSEYHYERPVVKEFELKFKEQLNSYTSASSYEEQDQAMTGINELRTSFYTMYQLAYIRYSIDTNDEYYKAEKQYFDVALPYFEEWSSEYYQALTAYRIGNDPLRW